MEPTQRQDRGEGSRKKEAVSGTVAFAMRYAMAHRERTSSQEQDPPLWTKTFFKKMEDHCIQIGTRLEKLEAGYQEIREDLDMILEMIQDKPVMDKVRKHPEEPSRGGKRQRTSKPNKGCYKCGAENHWKKDCPN